MKKPSAIQIFLANTRLWGIAFWVCPIVLGVIFLLPIYSDLEGYKDFIKAIAAGAAFGFLCTYFPLFFLGRILMKINGSPFHVGDMVHIMAGKHKGQIARVYEVWKARNSVRVELGEQAMNDIDDVYSYMDICRSN